jgi:hypothetical protein
VLTSGTRLGPYEVAAQIGAGGMGEVYKARDTRLERTVAIKVLPEALAADAQFRERFDREALAISKPMSVLQVPFNQTDGRFSPDGRWIAYQSNESGQFEVFVMAFDSATGAGARTGGPMPGARGRCRRQVAVFRDGGVTARSCSSCLPTAC